MGTERRSMIISDEEKKIIAYHEAGHALVGRLLPHTDPLHKVSIIPHGQALGVTQHLPLDEKHIQPKEYLVNSIWRFMGGRVAEELILNTKTTGASNDIERATDLARKIVCEYGMSENLGPLTYGKKEEQIFLGREISQHRDYSEETAQRIDKEVKDIVTDAYINARKLIEENIDMLHKIANGLLERETLDAKDIDEIMGIEPKVSEVEEDQE